MIYSMPFKAENFENKIQISISIDTKVGHKIVLEAREEKMWKDAAGNLLVSTHPTNSSLIQANNNHFLIEGSIRLRHDWKDGDNFSDDDMDAYIATLDQNPEYQNNVTHTYGPGWSEGVVVLGNTPCDWKDSPIVYEPDCYKTTLEILEDNTRVLCPMQHEAGWTFKKADVAAGSTITATKDGTDCFIFFGQDCEVDGAAVAQNTTRKLISTSVSIKNVSSKLCTLVKIYK